MSCILLIKAVTHDNYIKGTVVDVRPSDAIFGSKEGLPNFIRVTVSDRDVSDLIRYIEPWPIKYIYETLENNTNDWRMRISVDPAYIDASETSKNVLKTEMATYLEDVANATDISFTSSSVVYTLPKTEDRAELRSGFEDIFNDIFNIRRYYISSTAVNYVVNNEDGTATRTFAQLLPYVIDKLDE